MAISPESGTAQKRGSILSDLERMIVLQFGNRFIWLTVLLAGLLIGHLTVLQIHALNGDTTYGSGLSTFDLLASLMLVIETATIIIMLLSLLSEDALQRAWTTRWPKRPFSHLAAGLSSMPTQLLAALLLLLPTLYLHRYPELSAAQNISIPLTLLQRFLLVFLTIQLCANLTLILRWFTPLPRWVCALLALCGYWGLGYTLTVQSYVNDRFMRLNDVFYYNQLWKHIPSYPELMRDRVTLDINRDYLGFFLWLFAVVCFTSLLWLPRAAMAGDRLLKQAAKTRAAAASEPGSDNSADAAQHSVDSDAAGD